MQFSKEREGKLFPDQGTKDVITCMALTQDFLIYGTEVSIIYLYCQPKLVQ